MRAIRFSRFVSALLMASAVGGPSPVIADNGCTTKPIAIDYAQVDPATLGAQMRPRNGSTGEQTPYLGEARLEWALAVHVPETEKLRSIALAPGQPIELSFASGEYDYVQPHHTGPETVDRLDGDVTACARHSGYDKQNEDVVSIKPALDGSHTSIIYLEYANGEEREAGRIHMKVTSYEMVPGQDAENYDVLVGGMVDGQRVVAELIVPRMVN